MPFVAGDSRSWPVNLWRGSSARWPGAGREDEAGRQGQTGCHAEPSLRASEGLNSVRDAFVLRRLLVWLYRPCPQGIEPALQGV